MGVKSSELKRRRKSSGVPGNFWARVSGAVRKSVVIAANEIVAKIAIRDFRFSEVGSMGEQP